MKSKTPLALMEQLAMVLVFALAAAVCLQVFVLADRLSRTCEARDQAVIAAQSAAETLKGYHGDYERAVQSLGGTLKDQQWQLNYDENWQQTETNAAYRMTVTPANGEQMLLGMADIAVYNESGERLFELSVAWQEVDSHA